MRKHTDTFKAYDDKGNEYTIFVFTKYASGTSFDGGKSVAPTGFELETADGAEVNRIEKGVYEIVASQIRLTSDAANAP